MYINISWLTRSRCVESKLLPKMLGCSTYSPHCPHCAQVAKLERNYQMSKRELEKMQRELASIEEELARLSKHYEEAMAERKDLEEEAELMERQLTANSSLDWAMRKTGIPCCMYMYVHIQCTPRRWPFKD